jgi:hypothetical protein
MLAFLEGVTLAGSVTHNALILRLEPGFSEEEVASKRGKHYSALTRREQEELPDQFLGEEKPQTGRTSC